MENSVLYNTRAIKFIKILFIILVSFFLSAIFIMAILKIDDKVTFDEGRVYSNNPKTIINSPNEVKILSINYKEGQSILKGDTILVLENKKIRSDYYNFNLEIETNNDKINVLEKIIDKARASKQSYHKLIEIQNSTHKIEVKNIKNEINQIKAKIDLSIKQTKIVVNNYETDSILYSKGVISRLRFEEQKNNLISTEKSNIELDIEYNAKLFDLEELTAKHKANKNKLRRNIIEAEKQIAQYLREIIVLKSDIKNNENNIEYMKEELDRLFIISPMNGTISYIFNTKNYKEIILKGDHLVTISPLNENFYAKVILPEKDLIYIKKGQKVNLKIDAYNHYKYGAIKGNIDYVSPSEIENSFYCLVNLSEFNKKIRLKAGYKLKGNIVIEKMRLYEYVFKMLFIGFDEKTTKNNN